VFAREFAWIHFANDQTSFLIDQLPFKEQPLKSPKNPVREKNCITYSRLFAVLPSDKLAAT
jgi:hypothetical protein